MQFVSIFLGLMVPWYAMIYSIRHSIGQKQDINHEARASFMQGKASPLGVSVLLA